VSAGSAALTPLSAITPGFTPSVDGIVLGAAPVHADPAVPAVMSWHALGYAKGVGELLDAPWPKVDEEALKQDEVELVLQVNGKHRGSVLVPAGASREEIEALAVASEAFALHAPGATPKKVIFVPGRMVNIVI